MGRSTSIASLRQVLDLASVVVTLLTVLALTPAFASAVIDLRDHGIRQITTTGSIAAGSNQLVLPANVGFRVGDYVIVEIGNEPGKGMRGTRGVGGVWPSKSYATVSQMQSDQSQPEKMFVWVEASGDVYERMNGAWQQVPYYYIAKAIPRSLQARITAVSPDQKTLTLDKTAVVSVAGANVYLDVAPIINAVTAFTYNYGEQASPTDVQVRIPAGNYPIGGVIQIGRKTGWTLAGEGKDKTRLYTPKGVPSARLDVRFSPTTTLRDFTLQGNLADNGFGLNWPSPGSTIPNAHDGGYVTENDFPRASGFARGIWFFGSERSVAQDLRVVDVFQQAIATGLSNDVWAYRIESITNSPFRMYIQWQFNWTDSNGGGCVDCEVRSPYLIRGFEAFRASNVSFIRPVGTNATFAMNSAGNFLIQDAKLAFTPMSMNHAFSVGTPIVDINDNMADSQTSLGGVIRNIAIFQDGFIDADGNSLIGILITNKNPNVKVEGGYYQAPNWKEGARLDGAQALLDQGPSTVVDGFTVYGRTRQGGYPNIWVENGLVSNSRAYAIHARSSKNNQQGVDPTPVPAALASASSGGAPASAPSGSSTGATTASSSTSNVTTSPSAVTASPSAPVTASPSAPVTAGSEAPSPNGTRGGRVVDGTGAVWTFGDHGKTLRNGVWVANGTAIEYLYYNGTVLAHAGVWWRWDGAGWVKFSDTDPVVGAQPSSSISTASAGFSGAVTASGSTSNVTASPSASVTAGSEAPSPNGTRGRRVVDGTGAVWTFGDHGKTLRNGVWVANGTAIEYLYYNGAVLAHAGVWWRWDGAGWVKFSDTDPVVGAQPSSSINTASAGSSGAVTASGSTSNVAALSNAPVVSGSDAPSPNGTRGRRVVDGTGAVWTFGDHGKTLRNGVWVANGTANEYLYYNGMVFAHAGVWWRWDGAGWVKFGDTDPAVGAQPSIPASPSSGSPKSEPASTSGTSGAATVITGSSSSATTNAPSGNSSPAAATGSTGTSPNGTRGRRIVDAEGAVWTLGNEGETLRNGVWVANRIASEYLYHNGLVLAHAGGWWRWTGGRWVRFADTDPIPASSSANVSTGTTASATNEAKPAATATSTNAASTTVTTASSPNVATATVSNSGTIAAPMDSTQVSNGSLGNAGAATATPAARPGAVGHVASSASVAYDFMGNRTSGILWRNQQTGQNAIWEFNAGVLTNTSLIAATETSWQIVGRGDFDGDRKADILWADSSGNIAIWLMNGLTIRSHQVVARVPESWKVVGTGDFDGDGKTDILWRDSGGKLSLWLMNAMTIESSVAHSTVPLSWTVAGTGDFNGDGKADILWKNSDGTVNIWLMEGTKLMTTRTVGTAGADWSIVGVADYDGNGLSDILWHNGSTGDVAVWGVNGTTSWHAIKRVPDLKWRIVGSGDYDGDGRADILWRNSSTGDITLWRMNGAAIKQEEIVRALADANWTIANL